MKEEQNAFAYDNMDNGSNHSQQKADEAGGVGLLGNINMGNLVQNPGRGSEDSQNRKSATRGGNIFAQKVRKQNKNSSAEKSPVGLGTEEDSFQDEHLEGSFDKSRRRSKMSKSTPKQNESDYDDESSQSEEREFNL